jgi:hypothetical protein
MVKSCGVVTEVMRTISEQSLSEELAPDVEGDVSELVLLDKPCGAFER